MFILPLIGAAVKPRARAPRSCAARIGYHQRASTPEAVHPLQAGSWEMVRALPVPSLRDHVRELRRLARIPDGSIGHAELQMGTAVVGLSSVGQVSAANPWSAVRQGIYVCVDHVDALHDRANRPDWWCQVLAGRSRMRSYTWGATP